MKSLKFFAMILVTGIIAYGCSGGGEKQETADIDSIKAEAAADPADPMSNKGIGPVKEVKLGEIDPAMAAEGETIYKSMCTACHKANEKFIGPAPAGIMERRSPEWIMNMILNPVEMTQKDPIAKQLLVDYNLAPMADQNLTEDQARKILEYFRTLK